MTLSVAYFFYALPLLALFYLANRRRRVLERTSADTWQEAQQTGMTLPASLHPVIDTARCIGCESCVHACPEFPAHQVLGIIRNKATLVSPTDCIGHGACKAVCPVDAIKLVFGTAERGVDIPQVNPDFSTNVPGIFIAGELGGMGLIKNAINQGGQALSGIISYLGRHPDKSSDAVDVCIVGAGPAGIAATLGAIEQGLSYLTIEQDKLGGTVANFPRGKLVMTAPAELPLVGPVHFRETSKEVLVEYWNDLERSKQMKVRYNERLVSVAQKENGSLQIVTSRGEYAARTLLLAIGRRGTPRKLGVPGEDQTKVSYAFTDPAEYQDCSVLIVGGGDSALEAACSIAEQSNANVSLSYRSEAFTRAKAKNRQRLQALADNRRIRVLLQSNVLEITPDKVLLESPAGPVELVNDRLIICAGGILPDGMLRDMGIHVEAKYGTA